MATQYRQEKGQFHFHDDLVKVKDGQPITGDDGGHLREEQLVHSSPEVGVAYCQLTPNRIHVFTHGTAEGMKAWVEEHNAHSEHKASLKVFGQDTSAETLNMALADSEFFATLL